MFYLLKQTPDQLYDVMEDGRRVATCDLLSAEEFYWDLTERGIAVEWMYLEDAFAPRRDMVRSRTEEYKNA